VGRAIDRGCRSAWVLVVEVESPQSCEVNFIFPSLSIHSLKYAGGMRLRGRLNQPHVRDRSGTINSSQGCLSVEPIPVSGGALCKRGNRGTGTARCRGNALQRLAQCRKAKSPYSNPLTFHVAALAMVVALGPASDVRPN